MSFTAWDEFNEMTLDLTYIGEDSKGQYVGEAEVYISSDYYMYWDEDHYVLSINIDGDTMTLLEAEWAYNNVE